MNLTLIGMPGSGKSYFGKIVTERLGGTLIELDQIMESDYGMPLSQVLEQSGEETFIQKQGVDAILHTLDKDNLAVSPGGSIVYSLEAMEHLQAISKIIYLEVPFETIRARVADVPRGIVGLKSKTLEELYRERVELYKKWSSLTLDAQADAVSVVEKILAILKEG